MSDEYEAETPRTPPFEEWIKKEKKRRRKQWVVDRLNATFTGFCHGVGVAVALWLLDANITVVL